MGKAFKYGSGLDTSDANATSGDIRIGKSGYVDGDKIDGTLLEYDGPYTIVPTKAEQTFTTLEKILLSNLIVRSIPDNYIDTSDATATEASIREGYTAYVDGDKITGDLETYAGKTTVTPSENVQTLATAGKYIDKPITINSIPPSYKMGVSITYNTQSSTTYGSPIGYSKQKVYFFVQHAGFSIVNVTGEYSMNTTTGAIEYNQGTMYVCSFTVPDWNDSLIITLE